MARGGALGKGRHLGCGRESVGTDRPGRKGIRSGITFFLKQQQNKIQALSKNSLLCLDLSPRSSCTSKLAWDPANLSDATEPTAALTRFCDFFGGCWFTPLWRLTLDAVKTGCT